MIIQRKYKYISLVSLDPIIHNRIKHILMGSKNKKKLLMKYLVLGLEEALKTKKEKHKKSKYICSIPLRYDKPHEALLIDLKEKLGYDSSRIFINAILIGFKKTSPLEPLDEIK